MNNEQDPRERANPSGRFNRYGASSSFFDESERAQVEERLLYIAKRRYKLAEGVAEDLVREAVSTYLEANGRYAEWVDHPTQLVAILRGRCREHVRRQIRLTAQGNAIRDVMREEVPAAAAAGALDEIASRDARKQILEALAQLGPKAREALQSLRDGGTRVDLLDMIEGLGFHETSEGRKLRAYRAQFRQILARCGIQF